MWRVLRVVMAVAFCSSLLVGAFLFEESHSSDTSPTTSEVPPCAAKEQQVAYVTANVASRTIHVQYGCEPQAMAGQCGPGRVLIDLYGNQRQCADPSALAGVEGRRY